MKNTTTWVCVGIEVGIVAVIAVVLLLCADIFIRRSLVTAMAGLQLFYCDHKNTLDLL